MKNLFYTILLLTAGIFGYYILHKRKLNNMRLSKNFMLSEFLRTSTGLPNKPTLETVKNLKELVDNVLQPLRDFIGTKIIVTSGYRSFEVNKKVGGVKNSSHLLGQAADIVVPGYTNEQLIRIIREKNLPVDKVIDEKLYRNDGVLHTHLHISFNKDRRKIFLKARNTQQDLNTKYSNYFS